MTKLGMERAEPQKPLRRYTPLRARKSINKMSNKQKGRIVTLSKITQPEDGRCEQCHQLPDFRGLTKHHIVRRSHCGNDDRTNLIWLCGLCHSKTHGIKEIA